MKGYKYYGNFYTNSKHNNLIEYFRGRIIFGFSSNKSNENVY